MVKIKWVYIICNYNYYNSLKYLVRINYENKWCMISYFDLKNKDESCFIWFLLIFVI